MRAIILMILAITPLRQADASEVSAGSSQMTLIGNVVAGKAYKVTVRGIVDLYAGWNNGQGLTFSPDGKPTYAFPSPYAAFYPDGLDDDPSSGSNSYGAGGPQKLIGALIGSFTSNPQNYSDYFVISPSYWFTATTSGALYAKINDCCYSDNSGSYMVNLVEATDTVTVSATSSQMTLIGNVVAGKNYSITVNGTVDLYAGWNSGKGLTFTPDGKPTYPFPSPYAAFYRNGLDHDPSAGSTSYGVGGPQKLMGTLLGSFTSNPQSYNDYFAIGPSHRFTASVSGPVYAKINDCCFADNAGSYTVRLSDASENITYKYDAQGRLIAVQHTSGVNAGIRTKYEYDPASNRAKVQVTGVE